MVRTFEFAVLKLVPDALRGESVNLGIVVFKNEELDVRVGEVLTRARLLYPSLTYDVISEGVQTLRRFGTMDLPVKDKYDAVRSFGLFALGELGYFTADDSGSEYESKIAGLMKLFASQSDRRITKPRAASRLVSDIRKIFRKENVLSQIGDTGAIAQHKIVPEWPLPMRPSLKASFALRNGMTRVCEIGDLVFSEGSPPPSSLFEGAVTLDVAKREVQAEDRVFAYRARGPSKLIDEALGIMQPYATRIVDWNNSNNRQDFLNDWVGAANAN